MGKSKTLSLSFLIIGTFVGGGFASGKEIMLFYSRYGVISIVFCLLSGVLLYYLIRTFLLIGKCGVSCYEINIFRRRVNFKWFLVLCNLVLVASMFAGVYEIGETTRRGWGIYFQLVTIVLAVWCLFKGLKGLEKVNKYFIPVLLLGMMSVVTFSFGGEWGVVKSDFVSSLFSGGMYVFFNMLSLSVLLVEIGRHYSVATIKKASIISSTILTLVLLVVSVFFTLYYTTMQNYNLPVVVLAFELGKPIGYFMLLLVYGGMFTTLLGTAFSVKQTLNTKLPNYISVLSTITLGFVVSLFGFDKIVSKGYLVLGLVGLVFCIYVICTKKNFVQKS